MVSNLMVGVEIHKYRNMQAVNKQSIFTCSERVYIIRGKINFFFQLSVRSQAELYIKSKKADLIRMGEKLNKTRK